MKKTLHVLYTAVVLFLLVYGVLAATRAAGMDVFDRSSVVNYVRTVVSRVRDAVSSAQNGWLEGSVPQPASAVGSAGSQQSSSQPVPVANAVTPAPPAPPSQGADAQTAASCWDEKSIPGLKIYEYGKSLLSAAEQSCYDQLADGVRNAQATITIKSSLDPKTIEKVYQYYVSDHTEAFYMKGCSLNTSYIRKGSTITYQSYTFTPQYIVDTEKVDAMRTQLGEGAKKLLAAASGKKSDYDRELALHDALVNLCQYDLAAADDPQTNPMAYTAYGALAAGDSAGGKNEIVCEGYAKAIKLLLNSVDIKCIYVTGSASNGGSAGPHAWNIVEIAGKWYYLDATFDDPVYVNSSGKYIEYNKKDYTYFNFTAKADHVLGQFNTAEPFAGDCENYADMPSVG